MNYDPQLLPNAKCLRKNMTRHERRLWYEFLRIYPMKFRKQQPIGIFIVDFYCHAAKTVIELDGSQHFEPLGIQADQQRTNFLQKQGLSVLRFSNHEIDTNFTGVCMAIDLFVKKRIEEIV